MIKPLPLLDLYVFVCDVRLYAKVIYPLEHLFQLQPNCNDNSRGRIAALYLALLCTQQLCKHHYPINAHNLSHRNCYSKLEIRKWIQTD